MQKRSTLKSYCPGYYDLATGGVVNADDEDDEVNARREVQEELGINMNVDQYLQSRNQPQSINNDIIPLHFIDTIRYEG